jgi:hypothetical protein
MEVTPDQWQRWLDALSTRLSVDEDFRRAFQATPGKAVSALGVPNEHIGPLISKAIQTLGSAAVIDFDGAEPSQTSERRWADLDDDSHF